MDQRSKPATVDSPALTSGNWIALLVAAVILAEAIWGLLVSLINNLLMPLMARVMGGDAQSPLYLGKGDLNIPGLFSSIVELCLAGIVFVLFLHWSRQKSASGRVKAVKRGSMAQQPVASLPSITPPSLPQAAAAQAATSSMPSISQPVSSQPVERPVPPPAPTPRSAPRPATATATKPPRPKAPKEVYYNIVGEPINPTEDE